MDILSIAVDIGQRFPTERQTPFAQSTFARMIRNDWPASFNRAFPRRANSLRVKASAGMGQWNAAPFMAFLNPDITKSPRSGYYPVILYERGFRSFCLVMAQGADLLKATFGKTGALTILKDRAPQIRAAAPNWKSRGFTPGPFQTYSRGDSALGRTADDPWAVSVAFGKRYFVAAPPSLKEFLDDLKAMLELYDDVAGTIGQEFSVQERTAEQLSLSGELPSDPTFGLDGALRIAYHKTLERRQRNTKLVKKVKEVLGSTCQGCGVTLSSMYGAIGEEFIEAHHLKPLATAPKEGIQQSIKDFAVLCPTCHRIIHKLGCPNLRVLQETVDPRVRDFYAGLVKKSGAA